MCLGKQTAQGLTKKTWGRMHMRVMAKGLWRAMAGLTLALTVACTPLYRNQGYVPTEQELALVEVGTDTRETIATKIGRPSASGLLNDVGWYYVQSRYKTIGPRAPVEIDRQVVAITFAEDGIVQNVGRFGLEDGQVVTLSRRVTEDNIQGVSIIRQLLGNLGNLNAGDILE
jgi:outer membrane protein assembly factor BamE (lipoprotein component of BamABCDE complex)